MDGPCAARVASKPKENVWERHEGAPEDRNEKGDTKLIYLRRRETQDQESMSY